MLRLPPGHHHVAHPRAHSPSEWLTPVLRDRSLAAAHGWQTLKPAQRDAVAACCSAGLQLVWGPPGTGKTHVIATAISHLAGSERRVLLVSNTNIAVDTALRQALRIVGTASTEVVREGATTQTRLREAPGGPIRGSWSLVVRASVRIRPSPAKAADILPTNDLEAHPRS